MGWKFLLAASNFCHLSFIQRKEAIGKKYNLVVRSQKNNVSFLNLNIPKYVQCLLSYFYRSAYCIVGKKFKKEKEIEYSACCIYSEPLGKPFLHFFAVIH